MKRLGCIILFILIACLLVSCSDEETTIELCNCSPDQYCVNEVCYDTDDTIVPAPDETDHSK